MNPIQELGELITKQLKRSFLNGLLIGFVVGFLTGAVVVMIFLK